MIKLFQIHVTLLEKGIKLIFNSRKGSKKVIHQPSNAAILFAEGILQYDNTPVFVNICQLWLLLQKGQLWDSTCNMKKNQCNIRYVNTFFNFNWESYLQVQSCCIPLWRHAVWPVQCPGNGSSHVVSKSGGWSSYTSQTQTRVCNAQWYST